MSVVSRLVLGSLLIPPFTLVFLLHTWSISSPFRPIVQSLVLFFLAFLAPPSIFFPPYLILWFISYSLRPYMFVPQKNLAKLTSMHSILVQATQWFFSFSLVLYSTTDRMLDELQRSISPQRGPGIGSHSVVSGRSQSTSNVSTAQHRQTTARRLFDDSSDRQEATPSSVRIEKSRSQSTEQTHPYEVGFTVF